MSYVFIPDLRSMIASATYCTAEQSAAAAEAIRRDFVLIPRAEMQTVSCPDMVPVELFDDPAALEVYAVQRAADLIRMAAVDGLLVISRPGWQIAEPAFPGLDMGVPDGYVPVRVSATARRLPDQDEIAPSGEHAPGPHHPAADGGPGAPS